MPSEPSETQSAVGSDRIADGILEREVSRREFGTRSLLAGGLAIAGGLLAACTHSSGNARSSGSATGADVTKKKVTKKKGGKLVVGVGGGGSSDTLAPGKGASDPDVMRAAALYATLVSYDTQFRVVPSLLESLEPDTTGSVWTARLLNGATFHNGQTIDADAILATIEYFFSPQLGGSAATTNMQNAGVNPNRLKKLDQRTVRFTLPKPSAVFPEFFVHVPIIPADWSPKNPVGSGPFKYQSFAPGQQSIFTAFENWHGADGPYVDELVIKNISDDTARVNAMLANQVHAISSVPFAQARVLSGRSGIDMLAQKRAAGFVSLTMRCDVAPMNDVRVRQAMRLVVDRQVMIEQAFSGQGRIGNDVFGIADPVYDTSIPQRNQDIDQAKSLLRQAGHGDGLTIELTTAPVAAGAIEMTQAYVSMAAKAGITVKLNQIDIATMYGAQFLKWPFSPGFWTPLGYLRTVSLDDGPNAPYNQGHFNDAEFNSLFRQALATIDDQKRADLCHQMQMIEYERGTEILPCFPYTVDAASSSTTGWQDWNGGGTLNNYHLEQIAFRS